MKYNKYMLVASLLTVMLFLWGCEPENPGAPEANLPPETRITVAPQEGADHDHYVSPTEDFNIQWFGSDVDGTIAGYWVTIDGGAEVFTSSTDTTIAFESNDPDPANPGYTLPETHSITVAAQDDEGLRDATPASRSFNAINQLPVVTALVTAFRDSGRAGAGFSFEIEADDPNYSGLEYSVKIDGNIVGDEWDDRSMFRFLNMGDPTILESIEQGETRPLDYSVLTPGWHTLSVQARDLGGALSNERLRRVMVVDTVRPKISKVTALYGTSNYFSDGSIFYRANTTTSFEMTGTATSYFGGVQAYRYRMVTPANPDPAWSEWGENAATFEQLSLGDYTFQTQCRDYTGAMSDTADYSVSIVETDYSAKKLLIVNETKYGNGNAGSPDSMQLYDFYNAIIPGLVADGWEVTLADHGPDLINSSGTISPKDVFDKQVVVWFADDRAQVYLGSNLRILQAYLDAGGNFILCGWDVMNPFAGGVDSIAFSSGFAYKYLRIETAVRESGKDCAGMTATGSFGYSDLVIDQDKIPGSWDGMDRCWSIAPRHRTDSIGDWVGVDADSELAGRSVGVRNFSPSNAWRAITLGCPLYYMTNASAKLFLENAVLDMTQ